MFLSFVLHSVKPASSPRPPLFNETQFTNIGNEVTTKSLTPGFGFSILAWLGAKNKSQTCLDMGFESIVL